MRIHLVINCSGKHPLPALGRKQQSSIQHPAYGLQHTTHPRPVPAPARMQGRVQSGISDGPAERFQSDDVRMRCWAVSFLVQWKFAADSAQLTCAILAPKSSNEANDLRTWYVVQTQTPPPVGISGGNSAHFAEEALSYTYTGSRSNRRAPSTQHLLASVVRILPSSRHSNSGRARHSRSAAWQCRRIARRSRR